MDYVPWPENGCTLAEARARTADRQLWKRRDELLNARDGYAQTSIRAVEEDASIACLDQFKRTLLIAFGRPNGSTDPPQLITAACWRALNKVQWESSLAADDLGRLSFSDIRVYPPLLAPCRVDILAGLPLIEIFKRFLLGDPEVEALAREAIRLAPDFERIFTQGYLHKHGVQEWPLAFDRWDIKTTVHPDPAKRGILDALNPDPLEAVIADEARIHRYKVLITLARTGELEGLGLPDRAGPSETILRSIWSHEEFHFDPKTGDILQVNNESKDRYDRYIKRWLGVVLTAGRQHNVSRGADLAPSRSTEYDEATQTQRVRLSNSAVRASIDQAIRALWPSGIPDGLSVQQRDQTIIKWQRDNKLAVASPKTIYRHLKNIDLIVST